MTIQPPIKTDNSASVVKFTPRRHVASSWRPGGDMAVGPQPETAKQPRIGTGHRAASTEDGDDYRHRMLMNLAAFAFTVALTAAGIWLALSVADLRQTQDCVLTGRRNCAPVIVSSGGPA